MVVHKMMSVPAFSNYDGVEPEDALGKVVKNIWMKATQQHGYLMLYRLALVMSLETVYRLMFQVKKHGTKL